MGKKTTFDHTVTQHSITPMGPLDDCEIQSDIELATHTFDVLCDDKRVRDKVLREKKTYDTNVLRFFGEPLETYDPIKGKLSYAVVRCRACGEYQYMPNRDDPNENGWQKMDLMSCYYFGMTTVVNTTNYILFGVLYGCRSVQSDESLYNAINARGIQPICKACQNNGKLFQYVMKLRSGEEEIKFNNPPLDIVMF